MIQVARKKRKAKASQDQEARQKPLGFAGTSTAAPEKDDEERRLESILFGTPFTPSLRGNKHEIVVDDDEGDDLESMPDETGREFANVVDEDLFYFDANAAPPSVTEHGPDAEEPEAAAAESSGSDHLGDDDDDDEAPETQPISLPSRTRSKAAWTDPDDTALSISLASNTRLRKLRDASIDDVVRGHEYERRLRRQYEKINPTPEWALNARKRTKRKRRRTEEGEEGDSEDSEATHDLFTSTSGILASSGTAKHKIIQPEKLEIERLRDANQAARSEGEVKVVQFHPSPQIPVLLTAGLDRRVRLFNVDGLTNPLLQTLHIPALPITAASFHPTGSSILLTGPRPFYYTYDLQSGQTQRSPRGLWGTTFAGANPSLQDMNMEKCAFSPSGEVLAVGGRRGYVHLVDWTAGGAQVVGSVKMNAGVRALWWAHGRWGEAGRTLMTLAEDSTVYVWDVGERKCVRRWQDEGGFGSRMMCGDPSGRYLAIGGHTGLINIYGPDASDPNGSDKPKPRKTIGNLTTSISSLRFNFDSQLFAAASREKRDQMRIIHLPSLKAFANWPTSSTPLGHVTSVDFSAKSEYVAVGNHKGSVLLYHLRDFGAS